MRFRPLILASLAVAAFGRTAALHADDAAPARVTFYKDVLPIMQESCQTCHRASGVNMAGMIAPMAFTSYEEVRPWSKSIAKVVGEKTMPPWHATAETHGKFSNERTLTDAQIATIVNWSTQGAQAGNPAEAPAPRVFPNTDGWAIGKPDLVVTFPEAFFVKDEVADLYQNISVKLTDEMLSEDKHIKAMEFRAGSSVVHHIIAYAYAPGEQNRPDRGMLAGMAPGTDAAVFPDGFGMLLKKGTSVVFQMHYHKEAGPGTGKADRSEMAFIFHDKPVEHMVVTDPIANGRFEIPPMTADWKVGMARILEKPITIVSLMPHTHLRGTRAKYVAYYPDGTEELLLNVPKNDFNWQTDYKFREPKTLPAGTRLEAELWYDNSPARQEITSEVDPTRAIRFGGPTTDEMDLAWLTYYTDEN